MPGLELERVALDEVGILVAFQPDAVAEAMGEILVTGPVARVLDDLAGGEIHVLAGRARAGQAARAAVWAFLTMSQILIILSVGLPKTIVRVTSER